MMKATLSLKAEFKATREFKYLGILRGRIVAGNRAYSIHIAPFNFKYYYPGTSRLEHGMNTI